MSANEEQVIQLFEAAKKVYPREINGRFTSLSKLATVVLLGLFYGVPWLVWDGRQAFLFDLPARKFHLLGLTLWPQDFPYLALLLIIAALSLFFFTALAGRLWCGFACPQTVWTEAFIWMEQWTEGTRSQRMKLDKAPLSFTKLRKKASKQFLWITFSLWTGLTFVGYFTPIRPLVTDAATLSITGWSLFWTLFYGFATYGNAGYMREQVCKYMCPYARFQGAMFDKDSLIITYDEARGEPRGGRKRNVDYKAKGLGDCIDCTMCVQVCLTGIDIRNGLQYECIACAACIDACDTVMDKMGYERGLVRYSTEHALHGKPYKIVRPRTLVYTALLSVLVVSLASLILFRQPVILDVIRDRNTLFRDIGRQGIENSYTVRIVNKHNTDHEYVLSVRGLDGIEIRSDTLIPVASESVRTVPTVVTAPHESAVGGQTVEFVLEAVDDPSIRMVTESRFRGPQ